MWTVDEMAPGTAHRFTAALLAVATATSVAVATGPVRTASASTCPDVEVVFARGTNEVPGLGTVGQAFTASLAPQLKGRSLGTYAVNYPASYNFLATADGANDAAAHIAEVIARCPTTELVIGGFSQGAAAVAMLAGVPPLGDLVGDLGSAPPLPVEIAARVVAVAVFGNPSARFGAPLSAAGTFAGRAVDICTLGDPVCSQSGADRSAHSAYDSPDVTGRAAGYVAQFLT